MQGGRGLRLSAAYSSSSDLCLGQSHRRVTTRKEAKSDWASCAPGLGLGLMDGPRLWELLIVWERRDAHREAPEEEMPKHRDTQCEGQQIH